MHKSLRTYEYHKIELMPISELVSWLISDWQMLRFLVQYRHLRCVSGCVFDTPRAAHSLFSTQQARNAQSV